MQRIDEIRMRSKLGLFNLIVYWGRTGRTYLINTYVSYVC